MEIVPQQPYTVSYFITDHTDTATYYVRAVVYDTTDGTVLETHNLTQTPGNSRLFSKRIQAPGDPSGRGRKITVIATAYTDSGYTTKSDFYQEQSENYVVIKRNDAVGGGGFGIDYRHLKEIVEEVIDKKISKLPKPEKVVIPPFPEIVIPPAPVMRWDEVLSAIQKIDLNVSAQSIPEPIDLRPDLDTLKKSIETSIRDKEIPKTDISPVLDKIEALSSILPQIIDAIPGILTDVLNKRELLAIQRREEALKKIREAKDAEVLVVDNIAKLVGVKS